MIVAICHNNRFFGCSSCVYNSSVPEIPSLDILKNGKFPTFFQILDVAATVAEIFALEMPQVWRAQPMSQVFKK